MAFCARGLILPQLYPYCRICYQPSSMMHTFIRKSRWEFWSKQVVYDVSKSPKINSKLRTQHMKSASRPENQSSFNADCTTAVGGSLARHRDSPCDTMINVVHIWAIPALIFPVTSASVNALVGRYAIWILTSGTIQTRFFLRQFGQSSNLFARQLAIVAE